MSFHDPDHVTMSVSVVSATTTTVTTHYHVQVCVAASQWSVQRRYSDFAQLHSQLLAGKHVSADWLPPKKLLGNREPAFVERRRQELESYLRRVVATLQCALPECLADFLALADYDAGWMLRRLAYQCYVHESAYLGGERQMDVSPMQLSVLEQLVATGRVDATGLAEPRLGTPPSHVVAVASGVPQLQVTGSWQPLPASTVCPNSFRFSLRLFASLSRLTLTDVSLEQCESLTPLRPRLAHLTVIGAGLKRLRQLLLCGERQAPEAPAPPLWPALQHLCLRDNYVECVDESVLWAPRLLSLDLSNNAVSRVTRHSLSQLDQLQLLNLSNNRLTDASDLLHQLPASLQQLLLSANQLQLLPPVSLRHLSQLQRLDLSFNRIACVRQLAAQLPSPAAAADYDDIGSCGDGWRWQQQQLRELSLTGNPVSLAAEYRLHALMVLPGARAGHLLLDNECSTRAELQRVNVLHALAVARSGVPHFMAAWWRSRQLWQL